MTIEKLSEMLHATNGKIFSVQFMKRTTGELREMRCRLNVRKHLKGGEAAYNFSEKGLVPVFDVELQQYRSIALEGIVGFKCGESVYTNYQGEEK